MVPVPQVGWDGTVHTTTDGDALWATKGGGGGFGVITSLTYATQPIGEVVELTASWPYTALKDVISIWQALMSNATSAFTSELFLGSADTFEMQGLLNNPALEAALLEHLSPLLARATASKIQRMPWASFVNASAGDVPKGTGCGATFVAGSVFLDSMTAGQAAAVAARVREHAAIRGLLDRSVIISSWGGAIREAGKATASAFPHRERRILVQVMCYWSAELQAASNSPTVLYEIINSYPSFADWLARLNPDLLYQNRFGAYLRPQMWAAGWLQQTLSLLKRGTERLRAYINYENTALDTPHHWFGESLPRLRAIKRSLDPQNVFLSKLGAEPVALLSAAAPARVLFGYVPLWTPLPVEAALQQYTHVTLAFADSVNTSAIDETERCSPTCKVDVHPRAYEYAAVLKQHVPRVLLSVGGGGMNACWESCFAEGPEALATQLVELVVSLGVDGLDVNYESVLHERSVGFLVALSKSVVRQLAPHGAHLLTHAPLAHQLERTAPLGSQPPDAMMYEYSSGNASTLVYTDILSQINTELSYVIVQWYNSYPTPLTAWDTWLGQMSNLRTHAGLDLQQKVLFGMCSQSCSVFNVNASIAARLLADAIAWEGDMIAGAAVWEASSDDGSLSYQIASTINGYTRQLPPESDLSTGTDCLGEWSTWLLALAFGAVGALSVVVTIYLRMPASVSLALSAAEIPGRICCFVPCCREAKDEIKNTVSCFNTESVPNTALRQMMTVYFVVDNTPTSATCQAILAWIDEPKEEWSAEFNCSHYEGRLFGDVPCHLYAKGSAEGKLTLLARGKRYSHLLFADIVHSQSRKWWGACLTRAALSHAPLSFTSWLRAFRWQVCCAWTQTFRPTTAPLKCWSLRSRGATRTACVGACAPRRRAATRSN